MCAQEIRRYTRGWDVVIETTTDAELEAIFKNAETLMGANRLVSRHFIVGKL